MAISYKKIINGDARYSKLYNKTWCFTLPIYNISFINSIYVLICDIVKYIMISMLDHNVELQTCLQLFNNITNKHIYRVNKWNVIDRKCKTSSFVVKFRIPSITINNLFVWNCHFIKIDAQGVLVIQQTENYILFEQSQLFYRDTKPQNPKIQNP